MTEWIEQTALITDTKIMRLHLISIGGSVMHNIALDLQKNGHQITGSDDEIYEPAKTRLAKAGLLPDQIGWLAEKITPDLDAVILGMHARADNPELERAKELGIRIFSFPEFIYEHARDKIRIVVAGSHGKTTTTSMIMHAMKAAGMDFDYLVGGQIEGFNHMVRFSNAPIMVIEGDEYLSSAIDRKPKMLHYRPHYAIITGIAWDHMNVFPTYQNYKDQFSLFLDTIESGGKVFCFDGDRDLVEIAGLNQRKDIEMLPYSFLEDQHMNAMQVFGKHNQANLKAASLICEQIGILPESFVKYMANFSGTSKRLQKLYDSDDLKVFLDFAHAPSKLKATVEAVRSKYTDYKLIALYELHTYSSLNKEFLQQYNGSMDLADKALVYFNAHTLEMKKMPDLSPDFIKDAFQRPDLEVCQDNAALVHFIQKHKGNRHVFLFMTSGTFNGLPIFETLNLPKNS